MKCITYNLNRLFFASAFDKVREVMSAQPVISLPDAPVFVSGAIQAHQKLIPVVDLRRMLGLPARVPNKRNCILLLKGGCSRATAIAVVVDSVSEVVEIDPTEIRGAPEEHGPGRTGLLMGTLRVRGRLIRVLNLDLLLANKDRLAGTSVAA